LFKKYLAIITIILILIKLIIPSNQHKTIIPDDYLDNYNECISKPFISNNTKQSINTFKDKYSSSSFAIYFEDITNNYTITLHKNKSYYAASLIKLLDVSYLIDKSNQGLIDLDTLLTYKKRHQRASSDGLKNYKYGDKLTIKELINYLLSYSDNTAHEILLEYIGINNLKEYASSINVNTDISNKDHFGSIRATDTYYLLKKIYSLIKENNENSNLLSSSMNNTYDNLLNFDNITILHKYGYEGYYFHDIGIYNDTNYPYFISILTVSGKTDTVTNLHKEIYNIYKTNINDKLTYCKNISS